MHMRKRDAAAFLMTATSVVFVNAVFAVLAGCAVYAVAAVYTRRDRLRPLQRMASVFGMSASMRD
jgi:hypothetical protein